MSRKQLSLPITKPRRIPRYKLRTCWLRAMQSVGARTIEEAIITTYRQTGSLTRTGQILGFSHMTIQRKLVILGIARRPRGGNNNPHGRKGKHPGRTRRPRRDKKSA